MNTVLRNMLAMVAVAVGLLTSATSQAASYRVCVDIQVLNNDSEFSTYTGITEDYYLTRTMQTFPARGFYIKLTNGSNVVAAGYTESNTGCLTFSASWQPLVADVQVLSIARHGSVTIRAHNAGDSAASSTPGALFSHVFQNVLLIPGVTKDDLVIPSNSAWNAFATGSYSLWRVRTGIGGAVISMGFTGTGVSSAAFPGASSYVSSNRYLIRISNVGRRRKFEVAHEVGHAVARLNYGHNGLENTSATNYDPDGIFPSGCEQVPSYRLGTMEYDSVGFKESFAHIYAARVFNDRANDAVLRILSSSISLERFQAASQGNPMGGRLRNDCDPTPDHGVSTGEDWARFLWDLYTIPTSICGSPQLGLDDIYDIYIATRAQEPIAKNAWHTAVMNAVQSVGSLSTCEKNKAGEYANWNAIGGHYHSY